MNRQIRTMAKRAMFGVYRFGTRLGVHVLPVHYYSALPNILELERTQDLWARKSELPGLDVDVPAQASRLREICTPYQNEYAGNKTYRYAVDHKFGPGYGYIEAQALHAVIRHFKPRNVIEVGGGVSTYCMLAALAQNRQEDGQPFSLTCIEPYPSAALRSLPEIQLLVQSVQAVDGEFFRVLGKNDLLFIDSSHTVKPGGDVNYLVLEILPRLNAGVVAHFHDIFLPYDYSPDVLRTFFPWSETSLLRAFLIDNRRAKVIFCESHLHYDGPEALQEVFPEYRPQQYRKGLLDSGHQSSGNPGREHFPCSIYIQMQ